MPINVSMVERFFGPAALAIAATIIVSTGGLWAVVLIARTGILN
ncbi:MAG TPA: hypothetical protein VL974_10675 [Magnetospirillum sp.]|jgi:hypothetical protein|nr:hypothetical protein [Magnetospirillum sp.]